MGRNPLNALPKDIQVPLDIMENLHDCLSRFVSNELNIKVFKEDDLKIIKDLRKKSAELKDDLDTFRHEVEKRGHSIAAGNTRFAAKDLVSKYLSSKD